MQCLYCGKGIGPLRLLRDAEFCSDAHRSQFSERYRQHLYEALAPEPAPARLADFRERPATGGPPPRGAMRRLPGATSGGELLPGMTVSAMGARVDRPGHVLGPSAAGPGACPAWHASLAVREPIYSVSLSAAVRPAGKPLAGAARVLALAHAASDRPPAAAPPIRKTNGAIPYSVLFPASAQALTPPEGEAASPRLQASVPTAGVLAAVGPAVPQVRTMAPVACRAGITGPTVPTPSVRASAIRVASAAVRQPRTPQVEPLPVALEIQGARRATAVLPKPPSAAALTQLAAVEPAVAKPHGSAESAIFATAFGEGRGLPALPGIEATLPTWEQIDSLGIHSLGLAPAARPSEPQPAAPPAAVPRWPAVRTGETNAEPLGSHASPAITCSPAPIGALAGALLPGKGLQEAPGKREARPVVTPSPAYAGAVATPHQLSALTVAIGYAPMQQTAGPRPSAPPASTPSWDARTAPVQRTLVPFPRIARPGVDCLPGPTDVMAARAESPRPSAGRAGRSRAVFSLMRAGQVYTPPFTAHPIRVKFNDLLRGGNGIYGSASEPALPRLRVIEGGRRLRLADIPRWALIAAAAAALLVAAVLSPRIASKTFATSASGRGVSIREWLASRATRDYTDDFRAGLRQWKGVKTKLAKDWSYDRDGFIHPGQLALYRPSVPLSDYHFEFMAQIENKSVDWVVRAQDADNYYALKFTVVQPGPRPVVAMVRYPVIEGSRGARVETPLRMMIHANTPYRVTVDVKGNRYRASIEGQQADFWTEDRLKTGGVGFFSDAGERARVYWVKLESHGDLLGRICGLLSGKDGDSGTNKEKLAMDYRHAGTTDSAPASGPRDTQAAANTAQEARVSRVLAKAAALHLDGKLPEAAAELVRALDGGERHPALYFALGQLQYEMQEYLPASQSYSQAALLQPLHPTAHFNTGVCLGRIERWEEAAESFRKAISNDPARVETHLALGACLVQMGRYNEAVDAYDRFLARHPDHDEALFGKAVALQKRDRSAEAVELYRRLLSRNPRSEEALSNMVSLSLANQDYEQVRKYAQRLAEIQPKSQIALEGMAGAAFAAGDHQAAAEHSRKLADLAPDVFENWFNLGVACHKAGDLAKAAEAYARATKVQPNAPQAHLNLGVSLQEQGDLKGARLAYQHALKADPKLAGVHWNLGLVHEQLGDLQAAEKFYAQVPPNSPDSDDAAFRIGHLRLQRADFPGSIQAFEACLQKRPNWPEAKLNLGIAHWRAGDKDTARICFQELTASGGDSREALRGLAALALEHQDYDKAFEIYRQLLDSGDRSPELLYNAGLICQRRGEPEDAAVLYKEALKADPQFGEALLNLGHALMSLGNEFEARSCWRKAVVAKPELAQRYFEPAQAS